MSTTKTILCASLFVSVLSSAILNPKLTQQWTFSEIPPSRDLKWYPCNYGYSCAMLDVPLDYKTPSIGRASIAMAKLSANATATPYKGMVLINPGGPGISGVASLFSFGINATQIVGNNYDLVAWDPRGVNNSVLSGACNLSSDLTTGSTFKRRTLEKIYSPTLAPIYFRKGYAQSEEIAHECYSSIGGPSESGPHMTTATVARDLISILDAYKCSTDGMSINDQGLLNSWFISYGTFLGQTFASMFPDRVGRVMLDGVVDADNWIRLTGENVLTFTDDVFATFFLYCHLAGPGTGPNNCAFYTGSTPHDIFLRFEAIITQLNAAEAHAQGWGNATVIETLLYGTKDTIFEFSYQPKAFFPDIAQFLVAVEQMLPNLTSAKLEALETKLGFNFRTTDSLAELVDIQPVTQIVCSDVGKVVYGKALSSFAGLIAELEQQSYLAGEFWSHDFIIPCASWNISSDDRYTGPFGGRTKNPILFLSNTLDTVSPIQNGRKATTLFPGSQLLTTEATGHAVAQTYNKCAFAKINQFFQSGTLPGKNNYCALETGPFGVDFAGPLQKRDDFMNVEEAFGKLRNHFQ